MVRVVPGLMSGVSRFRTLWQADVADRVEMSRLRARIMVAASALGVLASVGSGLTTVHRDGMIHAAAAVAPITVILTVIGVTVALRGSRMGEWTFTAVMSFGYVFATFGIAAVDGPGLIAKTALAFVVTTVLVAVFMERASVVVAELLFAFGLLVLVAGRAPASARPYNDLGSAILGLSIVAGTVRLLRDRAISALLEARHGEITDPLTGLANRRGLERFGPQQWLDRARTGMPVTALVIDVDHFKWVNDTQGHAAGDEILRRLGDLLSDSLRVGDIAVRLGGEEFLVLCSLTPGSAPQVAERLRLSVERDLAPVTVSIGVYETVPNEVDAMPEAIWTAVDSADQALYVAKTTGRNRVVCK